MIARLRACIVIELMQFVYATAGGRIIGRIQVGRVSCGDGSRTKKRGAMEARAAAPHDLYVIWLRFDVPYLVMGY
jgi:hypothetical protein